jgi:hypothetical protein
MRRIALFSLCRLKYFLLIALAPLVQGCFFIYIPGSAIDATADTISGARGDNCVSATAKVGDRILLTSGAYGTIVSLSGTSYRCKQPEFPIRAVVQLNTPVTPATSLCSPNPNGGEICEKPHS